MPRTTATEWTNAGSAPRNSSTWPEVTYRGLSGTPMKPSKSAPASNAASASSLFVIPQILIRVILRFVPTVAAFVVEIVASLMRLKWIVDGHLLENVVRTAMPLLDSLSAGFLPRQQISARYLELLAVD